MGDCAGSESAALFGCGLLGSYLLLFIAYGFSFPSLPSLADSDFDSFYKATYKKGAAKGKGKTAEIRGSSKSKVGRIMGYNIKLATVLIAPSSRLWFRTSGER